MGKSGKNNSGIGGQGSPDIVIDTKFLEMLVCPLTHTILEFDRENQELICNAAKLAYPIRDGIPILLPSEARPLDIDPHNKT